MEVHLSAHVFLVPKSQMATLAGLLAKCQALEFDSPRSKVSSGPHWLHKGVPPDYYASTPDWTKINEHEMGHVEIVPPERRPVGKERRLPNEQVARALSEARQQLLLGNG